MIRSGAKGRDQTPAVDALLQGSEAEAQPLHHIRPEVFHHHLTTTASSIVSQKIKKCPEGPFRGSSRGIKGAVAR